MRRSRYVPLRVDVAQVLEVIVFYGLAGGWPVVGVVGEHPENQVLTLLRHVGYQLRDPHVLLLREVELHVRRMSAIAIIKISVSSAI